jgi:hypothetical protein
VSSVIGTTGADRGGLLTAGARFPARSTRAAGQQGPALHRRALRHGGRHAAHTVFRHRHEIQDGGKNYANGFAVL